MRVAIVAVALLASPALADERTTTCETFGTQRVCRSTENGVDWSILKRPKPVVIAPPTPQKETEWYRRKAPAAQPLNQRVGDLIADDDCPGAIKLALESGDIDLANSAKRFCEPIKP